MSQELTNPLVWVGFFGQALFFFRWIVQWFVSERRKESYIPVAFWWISLAGASILLVYSFIRKDPVFFVGQLVGVGNYTRNLMLIAKHKEQGHAGS